MGLHGVRQAAWEGPLRTAMRQHQQRRLTWLTVSGPPLDNADHVERMRGQPSSTATSSHNSVLQARWKICAELCTLSPKARVALDLSPPPARNSVLRGLSAS